MDKPSGREQESSRPLSKLVLASFPCFAPYRVTASKFNHSDLFLKKSSWWGEAPTIPRGQVRLNHNNALCLLTMKHKLHDRVGDLKVGQINWTPSHSQPNQPSKQSLVQNILSFQSIGMPTRYSSNIPLHSWTSIFSVWLRCMRRAVWQVPRSEQLYRDPISLDLAMVQNIERKKTCNRQSCSNIGRSYDNFHCVAFKTIKPVWRLPWFRAQAHPAWKNSILAWNKKRDCPSLQNDESFYQVTTFSDSITRDFRAIDEVAFVFDLKKDPKRG